MGLGRGAPAGRSDHDESDLASAERRFRVASVVVVVAVVVYACWLAAGVGSSELRHAVTHLVSVAAAAVAAWTAWRAHRVRGGRHRGWLWLAIGLATWATGAATWTAYDLLLDQEVPLPSYADLGRVGYALPVAIGVASFPRARGRVLSRWRLTLDGLVIGGSLLLATSIWVLTPLLEAPPESAARWGALAYPLADVGVASVVLTRSMLMPRARRRIWLLISGGLLTLAVTDSVYVAQKYRDLYEVGSVLDVGWLLAFALIVLAGMAPIRNATQPAPAAGEGPPTLFEQLLPYGAALLAVASIVARPTTIQTGAAHLWLVVPLLAVFASRQLVVALDHTTLARTLVDQVDARTTELRSREQWWRELVQNLSDVVVVVGPDLAVRYCSPSADLVLGSWPREVVDAAGMQAHVHPADYPAVRNAVAPVLAGDQREAYVECRVERADGSWGWFEVSTLGQLREQALEGTVLTLHDVSERRRLTDRLSHEAHHDALTGLPNRALLMHRIEEALRRPAEPRPALLLVDLDDFKVINDRHGHASGDLVLEIIGRRLRDSVRTGDTVARLGGDEFALLMTATPEDVRATADRLMREIGRPVVADGRRFVVRASIGVVFADPNEAETPHSLLSHADIALYEAKGNDKGCVVVIDGHARATAAKQVHLREEIAMPDLRQFSVVYQPIVDLGTGRMRGAEALLRWHHPDLGEVPPDVFIPMAEAGGSIQRLGWFVLREACAELARWHEIAPDHRMAMGVNVSSRQLDEEGFARRVHALVAERGLEPAQVVLELTEQSLSRDFETAVEVVAELRAGGVSVAVDDYGTGYSSLRYLHRFDADVVKIDRSFIAYLAESVHTQKIVRSVMDMATSLDLQSIGEGIETFAQLELLRGLGCELGQGYLFSRPVTSEEIATLLRTGADFVVEASDEELRLALEDEVSSARPG